MSGASLYYWYERHEARLHCALIAALVAALVLLFASDRFTVTSGIGLLVLSWGIVLLLVLIVASELLCPRVPRDVWREACNDKKFKALADKMNAYSNKLDRSGKPAEIRSASMAPLVQEALDLYRLRYTWLLLRRTVRRLAVLMCIALAFTALARLLVLDSNTAYGPSLKAGSSVIDYIYSLGVTAAYGNAAPVSGAARVVAIGYVGITISYLLLLVNYVWMHEGRRENLLSEYLAARYLRRARFAY